MAEQAEEVASQESVRGTAGNFRNREVDNVQDIQFEDWDNPWNFFNLFMQNDSDVRQWCVVHGLLSEGMASFKTVTENVNGSEVTSVCTGTLAWKQRHRCLDGVSFRCSKINLHEATIRRNSFFERSKLTIADIMLFMKCYLDKNSLYQCSKFSGVAYKSTAVDWASFVREVFKEHFHRSTKQTMMIGEIEIDESLFGSGVKYHRGNPHKGLKVWVFGMVQRSTNTLIMYPVNDRSEKTLKPLIVRHVQPGSTIYSDGWSSYCGLNELGYRHFTVIHKYAYKKLYRNLDTDEIVTLHTNHIEGAWKHAKDHFKRIVGAKLPQFECHLAEVMWRSETTGGNLYDRFFQLVKSVYPLNTPAVYTYPTPLFDSWTGSMTSADATIEPAVTDVESTASESDTDQSSRSTAAGREVVVQQPVIVVSSEDSQEDSTNRAMPPTRTSKRTAKFVSELFSSSEDEGNKTLVGTTCTPTPGTSKTASKKDRVCCPKGFTAVNKEGPRTKTTKRKMSTAVNPYSKKAYVCSSDDDFA